MSILAKLAKRGAAANFAKKVIVVRLQSDTDSSYDAEDTANAGNAADSDGLLAVKQTIEKN